MINYYNVIGDFLIEMQINTVIAERIRRLFESEKKPTSEQILKITLLHAHHTIKFSYQSKQLPSIRKKLSNCFVMTS